jgi:hypothetical protein
LTVKNPAVYGGAATEKTGFAGIPTGSGGQRKEIDNSGKYNTYST